MNSRIYSWQKLLNSLNRIVNWKKVNQKRKQTRRTQTELREARQLMTFGPVQPLSTDADVESIYVGTNLPGSQAETSGSETQLTFQTENAEGESQWDIYCGDTYGPVRPGCEDPTTGPNSPTDPTPTDPTDYPEECGTTFGNGDPTLETVCATPPDPNDPTDPSDPTDQEPPSGSDECRNHIYDSIINQIFENQATLNGRSNFEFSFDTIETTESSEELCALGTLSTLPENPFFQNRFYNVNEDGSTTNFSETYFADSSGIEVAQQAFNRDHSRPEFFRIELLDDSAFSLDGWNPQFPAATRPASAFSAFNGRLAFDQDSIRVVTADRDVYEFMSIRPRGETRWQATNGEQFNYEELFELVFQGPGGELIVAELTATAGGSLRFNSSSKCNDFIISSHSIAVSGFHARPSDDLLAIEWGDDSTSNDAEFRLVEHQTSEPDNPVYAVEVAATHSYEWSDDTFNVELTSNRDDEPLEQEGEISVAVEDLPIWIFGSEAIEANQDGEVSFGEIISLLDSDPSSPDYDYSIIVDWGDGTTTDAGLSNYNFQSQDDAYGYRIQAFHQYTGVGDYTINIEATASDNSKANFELSVTVDSIQPIANDDHFVISHDRQLTASVTDDDFGPEGTITRLESSPSHGRLEFESDRSFTYLPNFGFVGEDQFTYVLVDGVTGGASEPAIVTVEVVNHAPLAENDYYSYHLSEPVLISPLINDSDADGDELELQLIGGPTFGTLREIDDGAYLYIPNEGSFSDETFVYRVTDQLDVSPPATITIQHRNQAPIANSDFFETSPNVPIDIALSTVLSNDHDPDGDQITPEIVQQPEFGAVEFDGSGAIRYIPQLDFIGQDTFSYTVSDGHETSQPATVIINVDNDTPVAESDQFEIWGQRVHLFDVLNNDFDRDGDALTVELVTNSTNGFLDLRPNGQFAFHADRNSAALPVDFGSFTYRVTDGFSWSDVATVSLTHGRPDFDSAPDAYLIRKDDPLRLSVEELSNWWAPNLADQVLRSEFRDSILVNDTRDNATLHLVEFLAQPTNGQLSYDSNGSFVYQPNLGFVGVEELTYIVTDGEFSSDPTTVSITVYEKNLHSPNIDDQYFEIPHDRTLRDNLALFLPGEGGFKNTDLDGDVLTVASFTQATNSAGEITGQIEVSDSGQFTFTPAEKFVGTVTFEFTVTDGYTTSQPATVTIDVQQHAPTAHSTEFGIHHGTNLVLVTNFYGRNDWYDLDGDALVFEVTSEPTNGSLQLDKGRLIYTPNDTFIGEDVFFIKLFDDIDYSEAVSVTVDVINTAPIANDDYLDIGANRTLVVNGFYRDYFGSLSNQGILINDFDPEDYRRRWLSVSLIDEPLNGVATLDDSGNLTYIPNDGFIGVDTLTYQLSDGLEESEIATVSINVTQQAPVANDDTFVSVW